MLQEVAYSESQQQAAIQHAELREQLATERARLAEIQHQHQQLLEQYEQVL